MIALLVGRAHADGKFAMSDFVNHETGRGKTALSEAAKANHPEAIKILVEKRATIDLKTKFYRKTAIDWAANMKVSRANATTNACADHQYICSSLTLTLLVQNEEALDELKRAYKVIRDIQVLFLKIACGDYKFCKDKVMDGEHYRLNHVSSIEEEIKIAHAEHKIYAADIEDTELAIEALAPEVDCIHEHLSSNEMVVADIEHTADHLLAVAKALADKLQAGFSNSIIALQECGVAEVQELVSVPSPSVEILQVVKALCLLKNVQPVKSAQLAAQDKLPLAMRRPVSREAGSINHDELMGYWTAGKKLLKMKNLSHQLRYYAKSKTPPGCLEQIKSEITDGGYLDYDLKYKLFLELAVDGRERAVSRRSRGGTGAQNAPGMTREGEERLDGGMMEEDDISVNAMALIEDIENPDEEGFAMVGALAKWIKSVCQYASASEELEATKTSEIVFREDYDVELVKLKRERVDAEIVAFRLTLLQNELADINSRLRWAQRRIDGGEAKLSVAKLFAIVTPSGHSLLSYASAWGNTEIVDQFLDHGAYPGYGDSYNSLCAKVIQFTFRHHLWKVNRPPWSKELAREYRAREMGFDFAIQSMLDQMRKTREHVRMPLTEAFYNGSFEVADSFEKKKVPMYHACMTNVMPSGTIPIMGDPGGNEALAKPLNVADCARMGKERFQGAVWAGGAGWQEPDCKLDPFNNVMEVGNELWDYINGVVQEGREEMHKRRTIRVERQLRKEWGEKMDFEIKAAEFERMIYCAKMGALIDYQTSKGVTPLLRAALEDPHGVNHVWCVNDEKKEVSAVSYLLDRPTKRPMIDFETNIGHTALTFACFHARMEAIEALLDRASKIDNKVRGGKTALIYAAMNGKADVIKLLLERGADREIKDDVGKTANDWAFERNFGECLAMLARDRIGDVGSGKRVVGEAKPKIPCCWGCGVLDVAKNLEVHEAKCVQRLVPCIYCDVDDLQAREKKEHEEKLCKLKPASCPSCKMPMLSQELVPHMNKECMKRLERCQFCNDHIRFDAMHHHKSLVCKQRLLPCPNECGEDVPHAKMTAHKRTDCSMRWVRCMKGCGQEMRVRDKESHEEHYCPERKIQCEHCKVLWKSQQITDHLLVCEAAPVKCKNSHYGCIWVGGARLLQRHLDFACDYTYNKACPLGCSLKMKSVDVAEHVVKCERREVMCEACGESFIAAQVDIHATYECPVRLVPCGLCGEKVLPVDMMRHKEHKCEWRRVVCSNNGCFLQLPLAKCDQHEKFECRRAIVYCRKGCGNTCYLEKRDYHEKELCEMRFVKCPLCDTDVRDKEKISHMEVECVRRQV